MEKNRLFNVADKVAKTDDGDIDDDYRWVSPHEILMLAHLRKLSDCWYCIINHRGLVDVNTY